MEIETTYLIRKINQLFPIEDSFALDLNWDLNIVFIIRLGKEYSTGAVSLAEWKIIWWIWCSGQQHSCWSVGDIPRTFWATALAPARVLAYLLLLYQYWLPGYSISSFSAVRC